MAGFVSFDEGEGSSARTTYLNVAYIARATLYGPAEKPDRLRIWLQDGKSITVRNADDVANILVAMHEPN